MEPVWVLRVLMVYMVASPGASLCGNAQVLDEEGSRMDEAYDVAYRVHEDEERGPEGHSEEFAAMTSTADLGSSESEKAFPLHVPGMETEVGGSNGSALLDSISEVPRLLERTQKAGERQSGSLAGSLNRNEATLEEIPEEGYMSLRSAMKTKRFWLNRVFDLAIIVVVVAAVFWLYGKMGCPFKRWPLKYLVPRERATRDWGVR